MDEPQDENRLIAERRAKLAALRERGVAFPNDFRRRHLAGDLHAAHGAAGVVRPAGDVEAGAQAAPVQRPRQGGHAVAHADVGIDVDLQRHLAARCGHDATDPEPLRSAGGRRGRCRRS